MKFSILGYEVEVRRAKRTLESLTAKEVDDLVSTWPYSQNLSLKIARIKAVRQLVPDTPLADAKLWVEDVWG